ncbi:MAG TPA: hypothetical protein VE596_14205, partial [Gaiellaceae bacterium]|nr:hypothetical protein [Gaiellaceae bacterium]
PCPPCIEGTAVVGIGGGKGRHPNRLTIRPVLEQHIQIPILELAKDNVWRPVPQTGDASKDPSRAEVAIAVPAEGIRNWDAWRGAAARVAVPRIQWMRPTRV